MVRDDDEIYSRPFKRPEGVFASIRVLIFSRQSKKESGVKRPLVESPQPRAYLSERLQAQAQSRYQRKPLPETPC